MFNKFIEEITDIYTRYENWFECTCVFTAIKEINSNCTGSGVNPNSVFISSLRKKSNKDKFTFVKMLCIGENTFIINKEKSKVTIIDSNGDYMIELAYNTDKSYAFVDDLCEYILDHNLISLNRNTLKYESKTHHILQKILNKLSKEDEKSFYKKFYENLSLDQQNYIAFKSWHIGASIFKDTETRNLIENSEFKIEPPVDFINKNELGEVHVFFNFSNRTLSTCKNDGTKFIDLCKLNYSSSATHIYVETCVMKDKMNIFVPIMIKIINDSIYYYNGDFGWLLLGNGVLSSKITKNLIKV